MTSDNVKEIKKLVEQLVQKTGGDAKVPQRISAVNNLLNGGYRLELLFDDKNNVDQLWEGLFFAIWHAEVGHGFEEITASIIRGCTKFPKLITPGFNIISKKWYGLDQHRIDKISHLSRHLTNILIEYQVRKCIKLFKKSKRTGENLKCKQIIKTVLFDVSRSKGLCDFILEIFADETAKVLDRVYLEYNLIVGNATRKAKIVMLLYDQLLAFVAGQTKLESRIVRIYDLCVFRKLFDFIIQNESQVHQIVVTLKLKRSLRKYIRKNEDKSANCRKLCSRWLKIVGEIHENCINGEYFPHAKLPQLQQIDTRLS